MEIPAVFQDGGCGSTNEDIIKDLLLGFRDWLEVGSQCDVWITELNQG
jgi:hypothetical protein